MGDVLLSELCAICHVHPLKYKCPRCGIRTCSLACVKKHKLWSQCSGVRNPAVYRKRTELATPAGIDQDYNFITSVERTLQRADGDIADRGIDLESEKQGLRKGWARTQHAIAGSGAIVLKAPTGLSRSKQNMTNWSVRHKCLMWTIEWVTLDGEHVLAQSQAANTVERAFRDSVGRQCLPTRKRKRGEMRSRNVQSIGPGGGELLFEEAQNRSTATVEEKPAHEGDAGQADEQLLADAEEVSSSLPKTDKEDPAQYQSFESSMQKLLGELHFYLHSPNTAANIKRLIPVRHDTKIEDILQDRLLLEFPTIFVMREPPEDLRLPFISDEEYTQKHGYESSDLGMDDKESARLQEHDERPTQLDEKKISEVLQKDLGS